MNMKHALIYIGAIPLFGVIADQISKWKVLEFFRDNYGTPMDICADPITAEPGYRGPFHEVMTGFDLNLLCNWGISWGMLQGESETKRWGLTIFALVVAVFLAFVIMRTKDRLTALALSFIMTGSIGNAIDRFQYGSVVDFVNISDIGFGNIRFNYVFNIADSFITVGVALLLYTAFFGEEAKAERAAKKAKKEAAK